MAGGGRLRLRSEGPLGSAELRLDDEGGTLLPRHGRSRGGVRFAWGEVEKVERIRYLGVPFVGEAVRFVLKKTTSGSRPATFGFGGMMTKRKTNEILDVAESKGVRVGRRPRFSLTQP